MESEIFEEKLDDFCSTVSADLQRLVQSLGAREISAHEHNVLLTTTDSGSFDAPLGARSELLAVQSVVLSKLFESRRHATSILACEHASSEQVRTMLPLVVLPSCVPRRLLPQLVLYLQNGTIYINNGDALSWLSIASGLQILSLLELVSEHLVRSARDANSEWWLLKTMRGQNCVAEHAQARVRENVYHVICNETNRCVAQHGFLHAPVDDICAVLRFDTLNCSEDTMWRRLLLRAVVLSEMLPCLAVRHLSAALDDLSLPELLGTSAELRHHRAKLTPHLAPFIRAHHLRVLNLSEHLFFSQLLPLAPAPSALVTLSNNFDDFLAAPLPSATHTPPLPEQQEAALTATSDAAARRAAASACAPSLSSVPKRISALTTSARVDCARESSVPSWSAWVRAVKMELESSHPHAAGVSARESRVLVALPRWSCCREGVQRVTGRAEDEYAARVTFDARCKLGKYADVIISKDEAGRVKLFSLARALKARAARSSMSADNAKGGAAARFGRGDIVVDTLYSVLFAQSQRRAQSSDSLDANDAASELRRVLLAEREEMESGVRMEKSVPDAFESHVTVRLVHDNEPGHEKFVHAIEDYDASQIEVLLPLREFWVSFYSPASYAPDWGYRMTIATRELGRSNACC